MDDIFKIRMEPLEYNGWNTFETWLVFHNMFSGFDEDTEATLGGREEFRNYFMDHIKYNELPDMLRIMATSFIDKVDWYEIADAVHGTGAYAQNKHDY